MWPIVTYSNGGGLMSPDGKQLLIDKPESIEAMQMLADLYLKDKVAPSFADKNAMPSLDLTLLTGKVAMATSGQWEMGVSLKNSLKDGLEYGVGVLPKMKKAVTYNTGAPFGIFKTTKHLAAAMDLREVDGPTRRSSWAEHHRRHPDARLRKWYTNEAAMRRVGRQPPPPAFRPVQDRGHRLRPEQRRPGPLVLLQRLRGTERHPRFRNRRRLERQDDGEGVHHLASCPELQKYFDEHKAK